MDEEEEEPKEASGGFMSRFVVTAEVVVSKIFPAGFGWQAAATAAAAAGYDGGIPFFLATGCGDAAGVMIGHTTYYAIKKAVYDPSIDMAAQAQTGIMLATAAFHAGTMWQPIVDFLHGTANLGFNETLAGTAAGCGAMFFIGLRVARGLYSPFMSHVEAPTYGNLKGDAGLSISIGGATGFFVGTGADDFVVGTGAQAVDGNWLRPVVGIEASATDLSGMVSAGTSTALGFTTFQIVQNGVVPAGKNWVD